jgi:hypothetical protein
VTRIARYTTARHVSVHAVCWAGGEVGWGLIVSKSAILAVDDDPVVAAAITRDLRSRHSDNYRVVRASCGREALAVLAGLVRAPFALETSVLGVFAAGDVRLDSMKRVASAVGDGAMSVYFGHRYLATV